MIDCSSSSEQEVSMRRREIIKSAAAFAVSSALSSLQSKYSSAAEMPSLRVLANDPFKWSARETREAVLRRTISCREVVEVTLSRIEKVNPTINAIVDLFPEESLASTDLLDANLRQGIRPGPLFGVPITIKDNTDQRGRRTVNGVAGSAVKLAAEDSPIVQNLRGAGAIIIGRTNTPCLSSRWDTDNGVYGRTRNPYSASRTTGGSSGGAAAGLAAGLSMLGHGNDIGGSIRYPAFCCGVAGLRPSMGRTPMFNPTTPGRSFCNQMFNVEGMLARNVSDLALSLPTLSIGNSKDPLWSGRPEIGDFAAPKRIGLILNASGVFVDPKVVEAVTETGRKLADRGFIVEEVTPPSVADTADLWAKLVFFELRQAWSSFESIADKDAVRANRLFLEAAPTISFEEYAACIQHILVVKRTWSEFMSEYPVLIGPNSGDLPFKAGFDLESVDATRHQLAAHALMVTVNLLGLPAVAVPTGFVSVPDAPSGLPIGVQVIGARLLDEIALTIAGHVQAANERPMVVDPV